jgi:integrase
MAIVRVKVLDLGREHLVLRWMDPESRRQRQRSAETSSRRDALKAAAQLEADIAHGRVRSGGRVPWEVFRQRYEIDKLTQLAVKTAAAAGTSLNHLEKFLNPKWVSDVTGEVISSFQVWLRERGCADTSIGTHLRHLSAAFRWGHVVGLVETVPGIYYPRRARRSRRMKGRPLTEAEFERMLEACKLIRKQDWADWQFYLRGLWLSGLRLVESMELSWDEDGLLWIDMTGGRFPRMRILAAGEKGRRNRLLPLTPDFVEFLQTVPEASRCGRVFKLFGHRCHRPMPATICGRVVSEIGEMAGVLVNPETWKYATAHDLRRSFGTRWAKRVKPALLMALMRHDNIDTTMAYYVEFDSDEVAEELWRGYHADPAGGGGPVAVGVRTTADCGKW